MKNDSVAKFLIGVLERTGEVFVHSKTEAEHIAKIYNAKIINGNGGFLVTKNIKENEQ